MQVMGFSTPYLKKHISVGHYTKSMKAAPNSVKTALERLVVFVLLLTFAPMAVNARDFNIDNAKATFNRTSLSVNAKFDLQLSDAVSEALHNGVNIQLLTTLDLYTQRAYIWDKRIARWAFTQKIKYHSLTNRYVLTSPQQTESRSYSSLNGLFDDIENFNFQSDILSDTLPVSKLGYKLKLRIVLDSTALPAPLRVLTYISPAWKLQSNIHEWFIAGDS